MTSQESLLNTLLAGRSNTFKAKVLEIVHRHHLDCDDPNFQILIATGQLEVLLEEAPEKFEELFSRLLETLQHWTDGEVRSLQQFASNDHEAVKQSLQGLKQLTEEQQRVFERRLQEIQKVLLEARQDVSAQQKSLEQKETQQKAEHERQRETAIQEYKSALAKEAHDIIELAALKLQGHWIVRVVLPSAIATLSLASIGFIGGWSAKSAQIHQQYSPAELEYLGRLWRGNSDRLIRCQQQNRTVCGVHLDSAGSRTRN
jgi:NADH dehydrogenase/NADH:ubiquinone oxidoreductase subunit G